MVVNTEHRSRAFIKLGGVISSFLKGEIKNSAIENAIHGAFRQNRWFTEENVRYSLAAVSEMISEKNIAKWLNHEPLSMNHEPSSIGVIMPSNIPLAGFHDFFCVLMSGNIFVGKCSAQDNILLPALAEVLLEIDPQLKTQLFFVENFTKYKPAIPAPKAFIATGSNNSARYFEYYFGKYPHIIRNNRNSVAVLTGKETETDFKKLSADIFLYFGLGCRSVSKIFIPEKYDLKTFFEGIFHWNKIMDHNKYANNYTYYKAIYLMNKIKIWDNGFVLLKEDVGLSSPVAVLFHEHYKNEKQLKERLQTDKENIQCIVCNPEFCSIKNSVPFGRAQHPQLWDYADGVDTMCNLTCKIFSPALKFHILSD